METTVKIFAKFILTIFIFGTALFFSASVSEGGGSNLSRLWGDNRYETAIEVSKKGWNNASTVVLAQGENFPDALAGVPLAYKKDAPILLTPTDEMCEKTLEQIKNLGAREVIILGGENAVSEEVEEEFKEKNIDTRRLSGENRYHTASLIAEEVAPRGSQKAVVSYGGNFPDALAAASYAAVEGYPILLADKDNLPEYTEDKLEELDLRETLVTGGEAVINEEVLEDLKNPTRISGKNRYETAVELAKHFAPQQQFMFASGQDFPDAITGAAYAAREGSGILLVKNELSSAVKEYLSSYYADELFVFGGENAVEPEIEEELTKLGEKAPEKIKEALEKINEAIRDELLDVLEDNASLLDLDMEKYKKLEHDWPVAWALDDARPFEEAEELRQKFEEVVEDVYSGEVLTTTKYDRSISELVNLQKQNSNPVTDFYGSGDNNNSWQTVEEEDLRYFLDPAVNSEGKVERKAAEIDASSLNVRQKPSTESDKLTQVGRGDVYVVVDEAEGKEDTSSDTEGTWYKIHANNRSGWIYGDYAEITKKEDSRWIYQFLVLSGEAGIEADELDKLLEDKEKLEGQGEVFVKAGQKEDVNEIFLASLALHETGGGSSELAKGIKVEDKDDLFPDKEEVKVYNMFGIGAYDNDPKGEGARRAYDEEWFSPEEAIKGGAQFVSRLYINNKDAQQNTLYKMRWNPYTPGIHQYATDIAWAAKQTSNLEELYDQLDNYVLQFDIPKFKED